MKRIYLSDKIFRSAEVDDENYENLNKYTWRCKVGKDTSYARTVIKGKTFYMHQLILPYKGGFIIDHKDRNGLNNQRENLRYATNSQNQANIKLSSSNTSGYKGVSWNKRMGKWRVQIRFNLQNIYLGYFNNKEEAAAAYNLAALKYFGEFANINIIK